MRAARNPARYGPRQPSGGTVERGYPFNYDEDPDPANYANRTGGGAGGGGGPRDGGQTRTQGLARAIVDSFPLVKFVRGDRGRREDERTARREEVDDDGPKRVDGSEQWSMEVRSTVGRPSKETRREEDGSASTPGGEGVETFSPLAVRPVLPTPTPTLESNPPVDLPRADDRPLSNLGADVSASSSSLPTELDLEETDEHCPICLLDFEDGCVSLVCFSIGGLAVLTVLRLLSAETT